MEIRSAQRLVWENKLVKGFNTTDVPMELCLLQGEVAEAFDAWRHKRPELPRTPPGHCGWSGGPSGPACRGGPTIGRWVR